MTSAAFLAMVVRTGSRWAGSIVATGVVAERLVSQQKLGTSLRNHCVAGPDPIPGGAMPKAFVRSSQMMCSHQFSTDLALFRAFHSVSKIRSMRPKRKGIEMLTDWNFQPDDFRMAQSVGEE